MDKRAKILVTGASGLIGGALVALLKTQGYKNALTPSHKELGLCNREGVLKYFAKETPRYVFHLAARVGGIHANNTFPGQFIYENTIMQCNVFEAARAYKTEKILFPGSACAYPKGASQPVQESEFMAGRVEMTNLAYATAKINGIVMAQSYAKEYGMKVVLPMIANTYGINDDFSDSGHVIPSLIHKFKEAKKLKKDCIELWGNPFVCREFIHAGDAASALLFLIENYSSAEIINVGTQEEISIGDLAAVIAKLTSYKGDIVYDTSKPHGAKRKILDSRRLFAMGWNPSIKLKEGVKQVVQSYVH